METANKKKESKEWNIWKIKTKRMSTMDTTIPNSIAHKMSVFRCFFFLLLSFIMLCIVDKRWARNPNVYYIGNFQREREICRARKRNKWATIRSSIAHTNSYNEKRKLLTKLNYRKIFFWIERRMTQSDNIFDSDTNSLQRVISGNKITV